MIPISIMITKSLERNVLTSIGNEVIFNKQYSVIKIRLMRLIRK